MKIQNTIETLQVINANLLRSAFDDVNLQEATFTNVNLSNASFTDINFSGAKFSNHLNLTNAEISSGWRSSAFSHSSLMAGLKVVALAGLLGPVGVLLSGCSNEKESDRVEYTKPDGTKSADIKSVEDGTVSYRVLGGGAIPAEAEQLHRQARAKGESGDYSAALELLNRASKIAPNWAYPRYDMAFTYLLQGDATNALLHYREVDQMEPKGFFTTKTAVWALDHEERGIFPKGTYLAFVSLEWAEPEKKKAMVEQLVTRIPAFAPAWKEKGLLTENADQHLAAFEKALSLEPDAETYGICVLNKAAILHRSGQTTEAKQLLEELARSEASTTSTKTLAKETLKFFSK